MVSTAWKTDEASALSTCHAARSTCDDDAGGGEQHIFIDAADAGANVGAHALLLGAAAQRSDDASLHAIDVDAVALGANPSALCAKKPSDVDAGDSAAEGDGGREPSGVVGTVPLVIVSSSVTTLVGAVSSSMPNESSNAADAASSGGVSLASRAVPAHT